MNKEQFLSALQERLGSLSAEDKAERLAFYSEAIDDRMEDGLTEEEAVAQLGSADDIAARILNEIPKVTQVTQKQEKRRLGTVEIVLLVLGAPLWIGLIAGAFGIAIGFFAAIWSLAIGLWAAQIGLCAASVGCLAGSVLLFCTGNATAGLIAISVMLFCAGLSILTCVGCAYITKGTAWLTKKIVLWIVGLFTRKEK